MSGRMLLVGLGNPGTGYARNRHNVGFMALDALAARHAFGDVRRRFSGELASGRLGGRELLALKPMTFMNNSGRSVGEACRFYKIPAADVIVFHDDLDLPAGKLRVKQGGSNAGHNGLASIDAHIGADYWRVRIGISHPGARSRVIGHVLSDFTDEDEGWLVPLLGAVAEFAPLLIGGNPGGFASRIAEATRPPRPRPPAEPPAPASPSLGGGG